MIITKNGYIINYKNRETKELLPALNNTLISDERFTTYTLPKFLKIIDDSNPQKVIVHDYLKMVNVDMSMVDFYKIGQTFDLDIDDIFTSYIHINKDTYVSMIESGQIDYINLTFLSILNDNFTTNITDTRKILIENNMYENIKSNISHEMINQIDKDIVDYKNTMKYFIENVFPLTQIESVPHSTLLKENENINIVFGEEISLYTLFDNIELTPFFPFSTFNKYVKLHNTLEINKAIRWNTVDYSNMTIKQLLQLAKEKQIYIVKQNKKQAIINKLKEHDINFNVAENKLIIKYLIDKKYLSKKNINIDLYKEIIITNKDGKCYVNFTTNRKNKDYLLTMILNLLKLSSKPFTQETIDFNGKFFIVQDDLMYLNYSILSHVCLHTEYYIKINEFINASTKSNTVKLQYTQYKNIDSSIKNNIITNLNRDNSILNKYTNGTYFIEINILYCDNFEQLDFFIKDVSIILQLYKRQFDNLVEFYNVIHTKLNSTFEVDKNKPYALIYNKDDITLLVNDKTKDKSLQPYTKVCSKERKSHLKIQDNVNFTTFKKIYPEFNDYFYKLESSPQQFMMWPKDDTDNYLLYCEDQSDVWIYPGVTKDSYYPCCFSENQIATSIKKDHKPSIRSYYYDMEKDTSVSYNIKGPRKLLTQPGKEGDLLSNILILVGENSKRKSVKLGKTSFVDCIKSHPLVNKVGNIDENIIIGKQSNYNISVSDFKKKLEEDTVDCRNFTTFFEYLFNVYIFTFDYIGNFIIPKHSNGYIDFYFDKPVIFLYENKYNNKPQYEYIINTKTNIDVLSILKHRFSFFSFNTQLLPFVQLPFINLITSQFIDTHGKCKIIKIMFEDTELYALTFLPPLPILSSNTLNTITIPPCNLLILQKFLLMYKIESISQYVSNKKCVELYCKIQAENNSIESDVFLTFKLNSEKIFTNLPSHVYPKIVSSFNFMYDNFIKLQKISKSLQQYCLYLFSTLSIPIDDFFKNHITFMPPSHTYSITKTFRNNTFIKDQKLIISGKDDGQNKEIVKRLSSFIKLFYKRKKLELLNYKKKIIIDKLYFTISDFNQFPNQTMFISDTMSLSSYKHIITLPSQIYSYSYFIKFGSYIFLTHDTVSLSNAIFISNTWLNHNYNYVKTDKFSPLEDYIIYDINKNIIDKHGNKKHTILLRFINNEPIFSPLLTV